MNNLKKILSFFKQSKTDSRKKAIIKLSFYLGLIFFVFIFSAIHSRISYKDNNINNNDNKNTTTNIIDNYATKKKNFISTNHIIKYSIKNDIVYTLNGTIKNSILEGYLEYDNSIKKVILKNNSLYEIKNDLEDVLELNFDIDLINMFYVMNIIEDNKAYIETNTLGKSYKYEILKDETLYNIIIYTNDQSIYKIEINNENINYTLEFD